MASQLTAGVVAQLLTGTYKGGEFVIQIVAVRGVNGRFRVLINDGVHTSSSAMLNSTYNHLVDSNEIRNNTILRVTRCNATDTNGKFFAVLVEMEVIGQHPEKIGNPVKFTEGSGGAGDNRPANAPNGGGANRPANGAAENNGSAYGPSRAANPQRPSQSTTNNNNTSMSKPSNAHPIKDLNPYQNKWMIKGRVIQKNEKRKWSNARGEGTLFSFEVQDESSSIKVTAFKEECEKFYDQLEEGKVYYIQKGTLKPKDARYNNTDCPYELTLNRDSTVELAPDDKDTPKVRFNFRPIADIEALEVGEIIDVVGVVKTVGDIGNIISKKDSRELTKRDLQLVDQSKKIVSLTLWGDQAKQFPDNAGHTIVLAARAVRVGDFQGKNLGFIGSSKLFMDDPDIDEINVLRGWWNETGSRADDFSSMSSGSTTRSDSGSNWKSFKQTQIENLGRNEKPDYYSVKANVVFSKKDNVLYQACSQEGCNKKLVDQGTGSWRCEKCNKEMDNFKWRMILQVNLADFSDNCWATLFQEGGEALLGTTADDLGRLREENAEKFENIFASVNFKPFTFRMRVKEETYNDEARLKTTVYEAKAFDPVVYGNILGTQIDDLANKLGL